MKKTLLLFTANILMGISVLSLTSPASLKAQAGDDTKGCCKVGTDDKKYCCTDCCTTELKCSKSSDCKSDEE